MKTTSLLISATCLVLLSCNKQPTGNMDCIPGSLQNDVIAFYPFSNGSPDDFSGNNQHLSNTTTAAPTTDRDGNPDCAYRFNHLDGGAPEFLTRSNPTFLDNLAEFSVSLWYEPLDTSRDGGLYETLLSRDSSLSCPDRMGQCSVGLYDCRKAVFAKTNSVWDNSLTGNDCDQEILARTNSWVHLVATFNANTGQLTLYRNDVLQETSSGPANCGGTLVTSADTGDLFLGLQYTGKLDDVILFDKVLNAAAVHDLYTMGACCSD